MRPSEQVKKVQEALDLVQTALGQTENNCRSLEAVTDLDMYVQVEEFHEHFKFSRNPLLRIKLIEEESKELLEALKNKSDIDKISEACDLLYVTLGVFVDLGVPPHEFFNAIHEANMRKVKNPTGGKVLKPEGWQPADLKSILERYQ